MVELPDFLSKILDPKLAEKAYDDLIHGVAKQTGNALGDVAKGLRLFTAPFLVMGLGFDLLKRRLDRVRSMVPQDRQREAPSAIAGPILECLRYREEGDPIAELYLNLLARAIDKKRIGEAHPAFLKIIEQLSPDEVYILHNLGKDGLFWIGEPRTCGSGPDHKTEPVHAKEFPFDKLAYPEHANMYVAHLDSLNVVHINQTFFEEIPQLNGPGFRDCASLNTFGTLFVRACTEPTKQS